ncbi:MULTISPECIES: hypothetical protein [Mycobacterium]|jgi:hypothetical protein|uniref:hypothetical protein n=1 Tax=Mycobacterium TaxID=1763 RepID=UPI0006CAA516|nr:MULTISPECIES: hypothetical protein [Mycobacterium]KPN48246.1 hypothetical protein AN933_23635 [Mycobacterium intracellulare subsp. chimaera]
MDTEIGPVSLPRAMVKTMNDNDDDDGPPWAADDEIESGQRKRAEVAPEMATLRKNVDQLIVISVVLGVVVLFLCCLAISQAMERHRASASSPPSDRDLVEADLLHAGVHCFSGPAEMGVARQRALAAIDRYRWENRLDRERSERGGRDVQMWGALPAKFPEGLLSISTPLSEDASKCFDIEVASGAGP